jgi:hypothetical protein
LIKDQPNFLGDVIEKHPIMRANEELIRATLSAINEIDLNDIHSVSNFFSQLNYLIFDCLTVFAEFSTVDQS